MKLVILNGPTGVGKSTIAARLKEKIPSAVLVDIDELRRTIPEYRENKADSLRLAYDLAVKAAETALGEGKDVIIDKTVSDTSVLDRFVASARNNGADVHEFLLFADKDSVQQRADLRGYKPGGLLTREKVGEHWERADLLRNSRKGVIVIDTTNRTPDEVLNEVLTALD